MEHVAQNNKIIKTIYLILGFVFMGIGIAGYILPILPGTIFMILAAYCFLYSSNRLYIKVVNHPHYGAPVKNYIENNTIPRITKYIILGSIWTATLVSVFLLPTNDTLKIIAVILALIGSFVVIRTND